MTFAIATLYTNCFLLVIMTTVVNYTMAGTCIQHSCIPTHRQRIYRTEATIFPFRTHMNPTDFVEASFICTAAIFGVLTHWGDCHSGQFLHKNRASMIHCSNLHSGKCHRHLQQHGSFIFWSIPYAQLSWESHLSEGYVGGQWHSSISLIQGDWLYPCYLCTFVYVKGYITFIQWYYDKETTV